LFSSPFWLTSSLRQDLPKLVAGVAAKISHRSMESEIPKVVKFRRGRAGFLVGFLFGGFRLETWFLPNGRTINGKPMGLRSPIGLGWCLLEKNGGE